MKYKVLLYVFCRHTLTAMSVARSNRLLVTEQQCQEHAGMTRKNVVNSRKLDIEWILEFILLFDPKGVFNIFTLHVLVLRIIISIQFYLILSF